jgi:hypothetical protein
MEYLVVDGRMILKCIIKSEDRRARTGLIWLSVGIRGGLD